MITYLNIENLGIIDKLEIDFDSKLNILTGETGAGKTLVVESLNLLAGARFSKEMIKKGQDYLFVEASLSLNNNILKKAYESMGNDEEIINEPIVDLIISRKVDINSKNICKINNRLVSVNDLKNFVLYVIDIHGQNENQNIMLNETQIKLIDKFAKREITEIYKEYLNKYIERKHILSTLEKDLKDDMYTKRQLDLLKFQIEEIEEAELKDFEDDEIESKFRILNNSEKISNALVSSKEILSYDILRGLNMVISQLESISGLDEKYSVFLSSVKSSYYELEEVTYDLDKEIDDSVFNDKEIIQIENRLDKINSLKRKYGNSIEDIREYLTSIKDEHFKLENFEKNKANLEEKLQILEDNMNKLSEEIFNIRVKYAKIVSDKITSELNDLEMKSAKFNIKVEKAKEFNQYGKDILEFQIMTNKGSSYLPLEKIASGGEMSRIMLAIKTILSDEDETPILVFDEIDTGISGLTGQVAGEKLKNIANNHQVLCVTHLATLAAQGDTNYYIYKEDDNNITKTRIKKLNAEETIEEIARISSGKITKEALEYAKELRGRRKI